MKSRKLVSRVDAAASPLHTAPTRASALPPSLALSRSSIRCRRSATRCGLAHGTRRVTRPRRVSPLVNVINSLSRIDSAITNVFYQTADSIFPITGEITWPVAASTREIIKHRPPFTVFKYRSGAINDNKSPLISRKIN